ncbi:MAG: nucleoside hydrolase [Deltaproteobacteria bacterium]|jgi:pyrimidine-specific ribonucleoside hydrolase|nr:nucleoside hydrolase [Deltaproteobacteria bacterium]
MRKTRFVSILALGLIIFFASQSGAHTHRISLLIDTDMALDDIRALTMVLNSDWVDVPLIVCSDGAVSPQTGYRNLRILLEYFEKRDTDIVAGRTLGKPAPPWRSWSENLNWPESSTITIETTKIPSATDAILKTLNGSAEQVIYLCLGPLTNLADAIRLDPTVKEKISRVIFYGTPPGALDPDWNYTRDRESADLVFKSGLNIHSLHIPQEKSLLFDQNFYDRIKTMHTRAAHIVTTLHDTPVISGLLDNNHFRVWDEMTIIYLNYPSLFKLAPEEESARVMVLADFKTDLVEQAYLKLLDYSADLHLNRRTAVVLNNFPVDPSMFKEDVRPYVKRIIERHGLEEWKACLLTNEFHRHLGIYSIVGAKMGIRAREILEAPFDELNVISITGKSPPLSCMNDGLQAATGASLGRGAIEVLEQNPKAAAIFIYGNKKLTLEIKKDVLNKIKKDINAALKTYGGLNREYFAHIRKLSIDYWLELDRKKIFDETVRLKGEQK